MATIQTTPPAVEPVALADAKAFLRIDTTDEDTLIQSLITTSRLQIEVALGLALIQQQWSIFLDRWPLPRDPGGAPIQPPSLEYVIPDPRARLYLDAGAVVLPITPIQSVDAIRVYADDGTFVTLAPSLFTIDLVSRPARLIARSGSTVPDPARLLNGIEIAVTAGYGASPANVPGPITQALMMLVAHWYEHRDPSEIGKDTTNIPPAVSLLLAQYAPVRL